MPNYVDVATGRRTSGLRLVLTGGVPGPWSEAAKAIFHVKRLGYTAVLQEGGGDNAALREWTGQSSAPVAVWNDEPPRCTSLDILHLAERLQPEPALLPADAEQRAVALGLCHEIVGEWGFGWCRRLAMLDGFLAPLASLADAPPPIARLGARYGWSREAAARAPGRAKEILKMLARRLGDGRPYFLGDTLGALDLYSAAFAAMIEPLPPELCPMPESMRAWYTVHDAETREVAAPLLAHRDRIYRDHLELPMDF